jgi:hypothetical protein
VHIDTQDMGPFVEKVWGDDDYEFEVYVPAASSPKLMFALLRKNIWVKAMLSMNFASSVRKASKINGGLGVDLGRQLHFRLGFVLDAAWRF